MNRRRSYFPSLSASENGFDVFCWGPILWVSLNFIAMNYPVNPTDKQKLQFGTFFKVLGPVLPCQKCSNNYKKHAATLSEADLESREALVKWVFEVHNEVTRSKNRHKGGAQQSKVYNVRDMDQVIRRLEMFRAGTGGRPARAVVRFEPKTGDDGNSVVMDARLLQKKLA
jgi:hypothetical protein